VDALTALCQRTCAVLRGFKEEGGLPRELRTHPAYPGG
jgi:hypothetical protein